MASAQTVVLRNGLRCGFSKELGSFPTSRNLEGVSFVGCGRNRTAPRNRRVSFALFRQRLLFFHEIAPPQVLPPTMFKIRRQPVFCFLL
jgi:hypothetical protein